MTFRFGSWNVNNRRLALAHANVLRSVDCDVLAQEVSAHFHADLQALGLFAWSVSSLVFAHQERMRAVPVRWVVRYSVGRPFDLIAIRKDHRKAASGMKRGDLLNILLIQTKGGSARCPTEEDRVGLSRVAKYYGTTRQVAEAVAESKEDWRNQYAK
jgi:hypothetical protein